MGAKHRVQECESGCHEHWAQQKRGQDGVGDEGYEGSGWLFLILFLARLICTMHALVRIEHAEGSKWG